MELVIYYGILAIVTLIFSVSARTLTLWKIGVLLFICYIGINLINFNVKNPFDGVLFFVLQGSSSLVCYILYYKYRCETSRTVLFLLMFSSCFSLMYAFKDNYGYWVRANNLLYIFQSLVVIFASINRLLSRRRRKNNLGPSGKERRKRPYTYRLKAS